MTGRPLHAGSAAHIDVAPGQLGEGPSDTQDLARAVVLLHSYLAEQGYDGFAVGAEHFGLSKFRNPALVYPAPEDPRRIAEVPFDIAGKNDADLDSVARHAGKQIFLRWRQRKEIKAKAASAFQDIELAFAVEPTIRVTDLYAAGFSCPGGFLSYYFYASLERLGPGYISRAYLLHIPDGKGIPHARIRDIIKEQRNLLAALGGRTPEEARTIAPIVANAMVAVQPQFASDLLREIEAVCAGGGAHPSNPVKRKISNLSMKNGRLSAPVTLGRHVRFMKERLVLQAYSRKNKQTLPATIVAGAVGLPMRNLVDHPFLEGLTVRSATISDAGFHLRPEQDSVPLQPVIEALRAKAAEFAATPKSTRRTERRTRA